MTKENIKELEQLDDALSAAMLESEKEIHHQPQPWWSENLHKAHMLAKCWKKRISFAHHGITSSDTL
eukprot:8741979-Ditylum_brightwellii.AAC.2